MKVYVTFDVEVWCDGWHDLDARFPVAFDRYTFGRSKAGDYALPKTLEILNRHGLQGVFFVEPLFSARFGVRYLETMARLIADAGQDVQLHLHPEWTDEIRPPLLADVSRKRQHLVYYSVDEQTALIGAGRRLLEQAVSRPVTVFRAGSFAANRDTYTALARNGIWVDSSLNAGYDHTAGSIDDLPGADTQRVIEGVRCHPVAMYRDGLGRMRSVQLNGCSTSELRSALLSAHERGVRHFVIVSHNFEMLKPGSNDPDWTVVRRFETLCRFLAEHRDLFEVGRYDSVVPDRAGESWPQVPLWATAHRLAEQLMRRLA